MMKYLVPLCLLAFLLTPGNANAQTEVCSTNHPQGCPQLDRILQTAGEQFAEAVDDLLDAGYYVVSRAFNGVFDLFVYAPDSFNTGTEEGYDPYIDYVWGPDSGREDDPN